MSEILDRDEIEKRQTLLVSIRKHRGLYPDEICHDQALTTALALWERVEEATRTLREARTRAALLPVSPEYPRRTAELLLMATTKALATLAPDPFAALARTNEPERGADGQI